MTQHLLSRYFDHIDINDLLEDYCQQTRSLFEDEPEKVDKAFPCSIGQLDLPLSPKYDLIWAQCKSILFLFFFENQVNILTFCRGIRLFNCR